MLSKLVIHSESLLIEVNGLQVCTTQGVKRPLKSRSQSQALQPLESPLKSQTRTKRRRRYADKLLFLMKMI